MLLDAGKISVIDTFTTGMSGMTFLSHAE